MFNLHIFSIYIHTYIYKKDKVFNEQYRVYIYFILFKNTPDFEHLSTFSSKDTKHYSPWTLDLYFMLYSIEKILTLLLNTKTSYLRKGNDPHFVQLLLNFMVGHTTGRHPWNI